MPAKAIPQGEPLPEPMEWNWTVREVATNHRMTEDTVLRLIASGELKARHANKAYQIPDSAYRAWLKNCEVRRA